MFKPVSLRAILNFTNPSNCDLVSLIRLLSNSKTLDLQKIYITEKTNELINYSDNRRENIEILKELNLNRWNNHLNLRDLE